MARSKNSNNRQRDASLPSLAPLLAFPVRPFTPLPLPSLPPVLTEVEDRRSFNPLGPARPAAASHRTASRTVSVTGRPIYALNFHDPQRVALCVRRKRRRQVLFALKKTRKGSYGKKHRNFWSRIGCK